MRTIQYHEQQGRYKRGPDGKFDVEEVERQIKKYSHSGYNPDAHKESGPGRDSENKSDVITSDISFDEARRLKEIWDGKISQLKYEEQNGTLIKKEEVRKIVFGIFRGLRDGLTALSRDVSVHVAAEDDPVKCERIILDEITGAIDRYINEFNRGI
ncbi:hypothetical protein SAMN05428978_103245 [Nitrosomonas sp. Nm34]|nr:hypothetical protein SAMN05428978_103245 [Nitrosomonas sp. Nm34]